jgi:hypothetical protein
MVNIVGSGAEVGLLRHGGMLSDLDPGKVIDIGSVPQAGMVAQDKVPWHRNPGPLMHKRHPVNRGPKKS